MRITQQYNRHDLASLRADHALAQYVKAFQACVDAGVDVKVIECTAISMIVKCADVEVERRRKRP